MNAGADQTLSLGHGADLSGRAGDDGLPKPPGKLTYRWVQVSGPHPVSLSAPTALATHVDFYGVAGTYVFALQVSDGQYTSSDSVTVVMRAHRKALTTRPSAR